jgi:hypothetical protein
LAQLDPRTLVQLPRGARFALHATSQITAGATLHFQAWFRCSAARGGATFTTSAGCGLSFVPSRERAAGPLVVAHDIGKRKRKRAPPRSDGS